MSMSRNEDLEPQLQQVKENFKKAAKAKVRADLEVLLHANYSFISPEGDIFTKQQLIENVLHPTTNFLNHNFNRVELEIAVSADGNTVTEVANVELIGDLKGEDRTGAYINTATYVKGPDGWQILGNTITKKGNVSAQQA
jgi:ketosteroid isomerase-like protein